MRFTGNPEAFFKDVLPTDWVSDLLALVLDVWPQVEVFRIPEAQRFEPRISALLSLCLIDALESAQPALPFSVFPEIPYFDPITGVQLARTDLEFHPRGFRIKGRKAYFVCEAKCLRIAKNLTLRTNSDQYIVDMIGFVNDHKKVRPAFCGMLGYVLDGDVSAAFESVQKLIKQKHGTLHLSDAAGIVPFPPFPHPPHGETQHLPPGVAGLSIYHLLLPLQQVVA